MYISPLTLANAVGGFVPSSSTAQITIDSSLASSSALNLVASNAAGGITATVGTGGYNISGDLNLTKVATKLSMNVGAVTDFAGTGTLSSGVLAIANTNIATGDMIFLQRIGINASTALGSYTYAISDGASFTVTSVDPGTPANTITNDNSTFVYWIVRPT